MQDIIYNETKFENEMNQKLIKLLHLQTSLDEDNEILKNSADNIKFNMC